MPAENYGAVADPAGPNSPRQTKGAVNAAPHFMTKFVRDRTITQLTAPRGRKTSAQPGFLTAQSRCPRGPYDSKWTAKEMTLKTAKKILALPFMIIQGVVGGAAEFCLWVGQAASTADTRGNSLPSVMAPFFFRALYVTTLTDGSHRSHPAGCRNARGRYTSRGNRKRC